jgi:UDP-glucose 4-epimerase
VNFLITGSSGFIGKRLVSAIEGNIVLLSRSNNSLHPTIICDFGKDEIPSYALKSIDVVIHLAGLSHDMRDPSKIEDLYYEINVDATVKLAELAVRSGVKRFIFISSVKAGGCSTSRVCVNENYSGNPEGFYGKSKRKAELKLLKIGDGSGMHVSIIRPSLVYGPDVKGNLKSMLSGVKKGWFPPLPETGNRRSMIHVDDLVRAILLVASDDRANGEMFIATDGMPYSSREIYNAMCSVTGKSTPKWSVPKVLFDLVSMASPRIKYKVDKLLGDECYSSAKLEALGFTAKKNLKDMNKTIFKSCS